jgi:hypothetical protein
MDQRSLEQSSQELQAKFEELLESGHVYYNPPSSLKMEYDAIVFSRSKIDNTYANDYVYNQNHRYEVTTITDDPDAEIIGKISRLPMCIFDRHFVSDNLHHNVFTLYHY